MANLVAEIPGIEEIFLFGSRAFETMSVRSDIDLLVVASRKLALPAVSQAMRRLEPYLDIFVLEDGAAVSASNYSRIQGASREAVIKAVQAVPLWRGDWIGDERFAEHVVLVDDVPVPTMALLGEEPLATQFVDHLVITALPVEYQAMCEALGGTREFRQRGLLRQDLAAVQTQQGMTKAVAVVLLPSVGMVSAALAARSLIDSVHVNTVLLVGIAGGISRESVALGDVVIPNVVFDYEATKVTPAGEERGGLMAGVQPDLYAGVRRFPFTQWSRQRRLRRLVSGAPFWRMRRPQVHLDCAIACGHKVIADDDRKDILRETHRKTIAVEMESFGVAEACRQAPSEVPFLTVKGISDYADTSKDDDWHETSSKAAALTAVELIRAGAI